MYGPPDANSLQLLHAYFTKYPEDADKVVLSIKGGLDVATFTIDGSEAGVRKHVEACVKILDGKKKIDVFEYARLDPRVPVEETVGALKKCVDDGLIGGIGLSEVRAETVRRAAAVATIAAVEVELSLMTRDVLSNGIADVCAELGIPLIAYSPLGRGLLVGKIRSEDDVKKGDLIEGFPRFLGDALKTNLKLADALAQMAESKGCKPSQVAIAWVISQGSQKAPVIPIPGASSIDRVEENLKEVTLTKDDMEEIAEILYKHRVEGLRYPEHFMPLCDA